MNFKKILTVRVVILIAIISMIGLSYTSFIRIKKLSDLSGLVEHTHVVKFELAKTHSTLRTAEREVTLFRLTADSAYNRNLGQAETQIRQSILLLRNLTKDNPIQNARIESLDSLIKYRYTFLIRTIHSKLNDSTLIYEIQKCNVAIAHITDSLASEENHLLQQRTASVTAYKSGTPVFLFAIQILIILFLFWAYSQVVSDLKTKVALEKQLNSFNRTLEEQRDFVKTVLDNSVDVISVVDTDLRLLAFNKKATELFGMNEKMIGTSLFELFPAATNSITHQSYLKAVKGDYIHVPEQKSTTIDKIFESFFIPLYKDQKVYAIMSLHHDITELVRKGEQLSNLNDELTRSNNELEQFAYIASHDLQEPLRKILTFADLAETNRRDHEKLTYYLGKIAGSAQRMATLIRDVLHYSRVSNSELPKEPVDLNEILARVKTDFELLIEEKNATIKHRDLPIVHGSVQQLTQVFSNLISNSLKFSIKPPVIEVSAKPDEDGTHKIEVRDNGIGFEQKYDSQVFEVFKRLHSIESYSGTGIGLSICKRIISNHKGKIEATSVPGKGTVITIYLPASAPANQRDASNIETRQAEQTISQIK